MEFRRADLSVSHFLPFSALKTYSASTNALAPKIAASASFNWL